MDHKILSSTFFRYLESKFLGYNLSDFYDVCGAYSCHKLLTKQPLMLLLTVFLTYVFLIGCLQEGVAKHRVQFPSYLPWKERTMLHTVSFGNIPRISTRALYISGGRPSKNLPHPATKRVSPGKVRKSLTTFSDVVK